MDNFLQPFIFILSASEGAGGLFDFNATLPAMALQFILLTIVLTFVFYKPVSKLLEERETFINTNLSEASTKLLKADELYKQYDEQLKTARTNAQSVIAESEKEAKEIKKVSQENTSQIQLRSRRTDARTSCSYKMLKYKPNTNARTRCSYKMPIISPIH